MTDHATEHEEALQVPKKGSQDLAHSGGTYRVSVRSGLPGDNFCTCPDFSVNTLGTCKHIEWLLAKLERKRGGKKALREGYHPPFSEVYLRYGAERSVHLSTGTECPEKAARLLAKYFNGAGRLVEAGFDTFERFVRQAATRTARGRVRAGHRLPGPGPHSAERNGIALLRGP